MSETISLNKFISDTGYCSRREADELIRTGRVLLNHKTAVTGNRYKPGDVVEVDGSIVTRKQKEKPLYLAFNKPVGITTTTEEHVPGNIISYIGFHKRIFPIGRLDKDSEGLILLTNDGDMVNKLLRAGNAHEKEYVVRVHRPIEPGFAEKMSQGIPLDGELTLPCKVFVTGRQTFRIILVQGLNRQIRRMCEYLGYNVTALQRQRIMHIKLDKLATGKWRYLGEVELNRLLEDVEDSSKTAPAKARSTKAAPFRKVTEKPAAKKEEAVPGKKATVTGKPADRKNAKPAAKSFPKSATTTHSPKKQAVAKKARAEEKKAAAPARKGSYKAFRDKGRSR